MNNEELGDVMVNVQTGDFSAFCIYYFKEFQIGRFFIKKLQEEIKEDILIYISNNGMVNKVNITEFLKKFTNENEIFVDVCIISKNFEKQNYDETILLVPME